MKKLALAAPLLLIAQGAAAQTSLTLFGTVDLALTHARGSVASQTSLTSGNYTTSRLGFRGAEDLGGGMSAGFWIEGTVLADSGAGAVTNTNNQTSGLGTGLSALTWNRRSTVSLTGPWGEVRLGRDLMPHYINIAIYDPFAHIGIGLAQVLPSTVGGPTWVRASNSIQYLSAPNPSGISGSVAVFLGENARTGAATDRDGDGYSARLGYAAGPLQASAGHMRTRNASGNVMNYSLGASYEFAVARVMAVALRDNVEGAPADGRGWEVGAIVPMQAHEFKLAYSSYRTNAASQPKTNKLAAGYAYNLSKRTALYLIVARVDNSGGASQTLVGSVAGPNGKSTGFNLGVRHNF
jgi:predicted porin